MKEKRKRRQKKTRSSLFLSGFIIRRNREENKTRKRGDDVDVEAVYFNQ